MKITEELANLFQKCRYHLGEPVTNVELTQEQLCACFTIAKDDYTEKVQNWIIEQNWANLYGKNLSNLDLAFALSVRTLDMSKDYSYWFSRDAGVQMRGPWELKKDFFKIEEGKQNYLIPAGREINNVLWLNPPTSQAALYANYGGLDTLGFAGGFGMAGGGSYGPMGGFYIAQSMDVAYMATDLAYKNRLLRGDMTFKVTAGPDGTHIIHLFSTPGSKLSFFSINNMTGTLSLVGSEVWYTYYDVTQGDLDDCRRTNKDLVLSPDQIPLEDLDYSLMNGPTKTIIRKLFFAKAKETLAYVRGKFSGTVAIPDATVTMDYNMLLSRAKEEYEEAMKELTERLERMSPYNVMKQQAELTDNMAKIIGQKPMKMIVV